MEDTKATKEFNEFLKSIGGLENGFFTDRLPIDDRYFFSVGDGWLPLIKDLIEKLIDAGWDKQICQVKEKFAGLRFYINAGNDEIFKLIEEAESKSYSICEQCGEPGETYSNGRWLYACCSKHAPENTKPYSEIKKELP